MSNSETNDKTMQEQMRDITTVPVTTARANMHNEFKQIEERLAKLPIHLHGTVLNLLMSAYQLREQEFKDAISEHTVAQQRAAAREAERKQKELEAEQQRIAEANKPKLAEVRGGLVAAANVTEIREPALAQEC